MTGDAGTVQSGVASCAGSGMLSAETAGTAVSGTCTDAAGNTSAPATVTVKIDKTAPAITCAAPDASWHGGDVSIACTATDGGSGLANPADASFTLSTNVPGGVETASASTDSHTVCDVAGNCATAGPIGGIKVDKAAPVITISAPASTTYLLNQAASAAYTCADGGSGVATCAGVEATDAAGSRLDTASVGTKTFTVSATDNVGNAASQAVSYTVAYNVCPLYNPTKAHRHGSTVAIKLQLCDAAGANVSSSRSAVQAVAVDGHPLPASAQRNRGDAFRYRAHLGRTGGYVYELRTTGLAAGTHTLSFTAGSDPTVHTASFTLK